MMRQRGKNKSAMPSRPGFIKLSDPGCNQSIDCLFPYLFASSCSFFFFVYATLVVRVQGSQLQLGRIAGKMGINGA
jgi:hypothetical protein